MTKLSIIIPVFNEEKTICALIKRIFEVPFSVDYEIIICDDCSTDGTEDSLRRMVREDLAQKIKLLRNPTNQGKGHGILRGLACAEGDIVVVQDADFEYNPAELPQLLVPILRGETQVVYGSRFLGRRIPQSMAFPNYIANVVLTFLTNCLFGTHLTDMETCYKVIRKDLMQSLQLAAKRFDFEPEITSKLAKKGIKIVELPISYCGRTAGEGKKIKARDFFMAIQNLLRNRLTA